MRFLILMTKITLLVFFLGVFAAISIIWYFSNDLPDYSQLEEYYPPCVTRIYSSDGKLIEEYAREKRIFVPISNIPDPLIQAFVAAEDKNFYHHHGIDIQSIIRAAFANVLHIMRGERFEGGSTITQQVVKNFLLSSKRSLKRKIKEGVLSYMISKTFSKDQILELYLNQIFLGKGYYGVTAAALGYFNKSVEELSVAESAFLASLPKAPSHYGLEKNYQKALKRRNYVIGRMYDDGYITEKEAIKSLKEPIKFIKQDKVQTIDADYYAQQVRAEVIDMFGKEYFYTAGLTIISCADSKLQEAAANSLRAGIRKYDMKRGYRGAIKNISLANWQKDLLNIKKPAGLREYKLAVVLEVENSQGKIGLENGETGIIKISDMAWTKTNLKSVRSLLKNGDVIVVKATKNGYKLRQIPEFNGGIMVVEPYTGKILAAEGGYDYSVSKFDRTTQAKRQPGSLIKPFVYLAALENGSKPTDIIDDLPIEIYQEKGMPVWKPKNWDDKFMGTMTFRKGLEKSRNGTTVRIGEMIGLKKVAETFKRFGINDNPSDKFPSIVLGALETTLERMTMAYSTVVNKGKKVTPHYIELIKDRKGNVLYRRNYVDCDECLHYEHDELGRPMPPMTPSLLKDVITDEATSYQIISILTGAIKRGTAHEAKNLPQTIAGKTGTSNEGKDTWFVGFTPKMVIGTYVGYDAPSSLGKRAYGATVALPVFINFMKTGYKDIESVDFEVPKSINLVSVDYETGEASTKKGAIIEALKNDYYNDKKRQDEDFSYPYKSLDPFSDQIY